MNQERAETIALQALGWIVDNEDLRGVFMGATGSSEDDLRSRLSDPAFLVAVLDFLCNDDAWVIGFCDQAGLVYTDPLAARHALPGGAEVSWT